MVNIFTNNRLGIPFKSRCLIVCIFLQCNSVTSKTIILTVFCHNYLQNISVYSLINSEQESYFEADPNPVQFNDYEVGKIYQVSTIILCQNYRENNYSNLYIFVEYFFDFITFHKARSIDNLRKRLTFVNSTFTAVRADKEKCFTLLRISILY